MSGMEVWPNDSSYQDLRLIDDENQGEQIKYAIFGRIGSFLGRKRVVRRLEDIQKALTSVVGDLEGVNLAHGLLTYGVPLSKNRTLEFGLTSLRDKPFDRKTKYVVYVTNN